MRPSSVHGGKHHHLRRLMARRVFLSAILASVVLMMFFVFRSIAPPTTRTTKGKEASSVDDHSNNDRRQRSQADPGKRHNQDRRHLSSSEEKVLGDEGGTTEQGKPEEGGELSKRNAVPVNANGGGSDRALFGAPVDKQAMLRAAGGLGHADHVQHHHNVLPVEKDRHKHQDQDEQRKVPTNFKGTHQQPNAFECVEESIDISHIDSLLIETAGCCLGTPEQEVLFSTLLAYTGRMACRQVLPRLRPRWIFRNNSEYPLHVLQIGAGAGDEEDDPLFPFLSEGIAFAVVVEPTPWLFNRLVDSYSHVSEFVKAVNVAVLPDADAAFVKHIVSTADETATKSTSHGEEGEAAVDGEEPKEGAEAQHNKQQREKKNTKKEQKVDFYAPVANAPVEVRGFGNRRLPKPNIETLQQMKQNNNGEVYLEKLQVNAALAGSLFEDDMSPAAMGHHFHDHSSYSPTVFAEQVPSWFRSRAPDVLVIDIDGDDVRVVKDLIEHFRRLFGAGTPESIVGVIQYERKHVSGVDLGDLRGYLKWIGYCVIATRFDDVAYHVETTGISHESCGWAVRLERCRDSASLLSKCH